jgi:hypothetical protein
VQLVQLVQRALLELLAQQELKGQLVLLVRRVFKVFKGKQGQPELLVLLALRVLLVLQALRVLLELRVQLVLLVLRASKEFRV